MRVKLEVCVDSIDGVLAAVDGGADRIELCAALEVGGLTPSVATMRRAAGVGVPVHALIRPRAGDFVYGANEEAIMRGDVAAAGDAGLAGVVLGAATPDGRLSEALADLRAEAGSMSATLHRVFDLVPDFAEAIHTAVAMGFDRILTSGGAVGAPEGAEALARIVALAGPRIRIMPGAGLTSANVRAFLARVPVDEVHSSCSLSRTLDPRAVALGFGAPERLETDVEEVRRMKAELH